MAVTNQGPTRPGDTLLAGTVNGDAVVAVDADGVPLNPGGTLKGCFLGTAGGTDAPTDSTGSSTTAVYAEVPSGKVWHVHRIKAVIVDAAVGGGPMTFGTRAAPAADQGVRVRTVAADHTTTLGLIIGSAHTNGVLLAMCGASQADAVYGASLTFVGAVYKLPVPLVLTAGQRVVVQHLASVAYTAGYWAVEYVESSA